MLSTNVVHALARVDHVVEGLAICVCALPFLALDCHGYVWALVPLQQGKHVFWHYIFVSFHAVDWQAVVVLYLGHIIFERV